MLLLLSYYLTIALTLGICDFLLKTVKKKSDTFIENKQMKLAEQKSSNTLADQVCKFRSQRAFTLQLHLRYSLYPKRFQFAHPPSPR